MAEDRVNHLEATAVHLRRQPDELLREAAERVLKMYPIEDCLGGDECALHTVALAIEPFLSVLQAADNVVGVRYGISPLPTDGDYGLDSAIVDLQVAITEIKRMSWEGEE